MDRRRHLQFAQTGPGSSTSRYTGLAPAVEKETERIIQATGRLRALTAELMQRTRSELTWSWVWIGIAILLGGFVLGMTWGQRNTVSAIRELQQQVNQLQQSIASQQAAPVKSQRGKNRAAAGGKCENSKMRLRRKPTAASCAAFDGERDPRSAPPLLRPPPSISPGSVKSSRRGLRKNANNRENCWAVP
ncbi:MAG TPA: hypothetical protein VF283_17480 [Bryobacteraceae bacterium]